MESNNSLKLAPLIDRFLAFVFDVILCSPFCGLVLSPIWRPIEKLLQGNGQNIEMLIFSLSFFFYGFILVVALQTISLFWFQTTPGKYFFKIKVVTENGGRLSFHQALLRSFFWTFELVFLAIPFVEVASEQRRRPIHDRVAGTVVVTLKTIGDIGPHPVERHFVRQILLMATTAMFAFVLLFINHFYNLANSGEFKKAQLESEDYLCSEVSEKIKKEKPRIDQALALFLADEILPECLLAESDFILWRPDNLLADWAYLAKAYLGKNNSEIFEAYLNRTCEENEDGIACKIARHEANPGDNKLTTQIISESSTGEILQAISDFEDGRYKLAEKRFIDLTKRGGFEHFAQAGLIKSLWATNKKERSIGAYQAAVSNFNWEDRLEIATWTCHEQLDEACTTEVKPACEDMKTALEIDHENRLDSFTSLALIRENECRGVQSQDWRKFHGIFERKKDLYSFVRAIASDSKISKEQRNSILEDLAFRQGTVSPQFIRRMALVYLSESMSDKRQIEKVVRFLKERKRKDLSWIKSYQRALVSLAKMGKQKELIEIIDLPSDELVAAYNLETRKAQALFIAKDFNSLERRLAHRRSPASIKEKELSWETLERAVKERK